MKKIHKFWLVIAFSAMIGIIFGGCEGSMGPIGGEGEEGTPAPAPELVVDISIDDEFSVYLGQSVTLVASTMPENASVQTLLWELYDEKDGEFININGLSMITGDSVQINALADGVARVVVTALGSGSEEVYKVLTIEVVGVATQLSRIPALLEAGETKFEIYAHGYESLFPHVLDFSEDFPSVEIEVSIRRGTPGGELSLGEPGQIFTVGKDVTLALEQNLVVRGLQNNTGGALITVDADGTLVLDTGARITDNSNTVPFTHAGGVRSPFHTQGGGVRVAVGGTFIMRNGYISNNEVLGSIGSIAVHGGGGVFNDGVFIMEGGKIYNNFSLQGGGILNIGSVEFPAEFTMKYGEISGNEANDNGGGIHTGMAIGSGVTEVRVPSIFTMHDGSISNNNALSGGGVRNVGYFTMHDGLISNNRGYRGNVGSTGGVRNNHTFIMHNGIITGNRSWSNSAGVANNNAPIGIMPTFIMHNGEITNNTVRDGNSGMAPGVLNAGDFVMWNGRISGNTAPETSTSAQGGGGVHTGTRVNPPNTFTMHDGEIFDNFARHGGGVHMNNHSIFTMNGGRIFNNESATHGGGVSFGGGAVAAPGTFNMNGGEIFGNIAATSGGGVHAAANSTFNMVYGRIYDNTAGTHGGGVSINIATSAFNMTDGEISGNTAAQGGGVENRGTFNMTDGEISGNNAAFGAGVMQNAAAGMFHMLGGEIHGNTAATSGGGIMNNAGTTRLHTALIHGTDAAQALRNTAPAGASLNIAAGAVEYGTFTGDPIPGNWNMEGELVTLDVNIEVLNGLLIMPQATPLVGTPTITYETPSVSVNTVLTAGTAGITGGVGAFRFEWQRGTGGSWTTITGQTGATYTVVDADIGNEIRVVVSRLLASNTLESAPVGPVL